jgi:hypothetical protein
MCYSTLALPASSLIQRPEAAPPASRPSRPAARLPAAAPARADAVVLQRCLGTCTCGGACGGEREDPLAAQLRGAVAARANTAMLQRVRTRHADQTCEDDVYDPLRDEVSACKLLECSCSDQTERKDLGLGSVKQLQKKGAPRWSCAEITRRRDNAQRYADARRTFQDTCFTGKTDKGHEEAMDNLANAIATCNEKRKDRGCV